MLNQVINIHRKKYAVGLFWQPIAAGYFARGYARILSKTVDKKLNLFAECRDMVGLGSKKLGQKVGMSSAAAEVLNALSEFTSFLAVFQVDKLYYLVVVRNGIILEDKLFDNEEQARAEYFNLSEIPDWGALFAPSAWGMPRSIERNLEDLIAGNYHSLLKPISRIKTGIASGVLLVFFVLGLIYFFREPISQMFVSKPQVANINPELVAEYKRQIEEKNKQLDKQFEIEKKEPEPLVFPYDYLPDPIQRAAVCYQAIGFLMQPITGWNQLSVDCGETHAIARLSRDFGTLTDFYLIATELMPASFVQEESENSILVQATLPSLTTYASLDERDAATIVRDVNSLFQGLNMPVETNVVLDSITNGFETASYNVVEVAAESKLEPVNFMEIFQDFDGVYMSRCMWNVQNRTWNYEVIIYAK